MYEKFFGFREKPFKLVPNPAYLFLSKSHEEALAHLNYALSQGDGFVEITGEVGTGKTTLCRAFLENLDDNTVAAYIFNPRLEPKQLIKTINDELGISYDVDNTKDLIDKLNAFLMRQKAKNKKVILLIDEAQNLSKNVLEQLRLLSNLETTQEKLIQIILVGQPELSDILDSHELRQLGQRITLRYHLTPLSFKETVEYIQYRINIAARKKGLKIDRAAFRRIYQYSRGIPRVINIACDRALLTAFGLSQHKITGSAAQVSIQELSTRGAVKRYDFVANRKNLVILSVLGIVGTAAFFHRPLVQAVNSFFQPQPVENRQPSAVKPPKADVKIVSTPVAPPAVVEQPGPSGRDEPAPVLLERVNIADYLMAMDIRESRYSALKNALEPWQATVEFKPYLENMDDDPAFFRLTAKPDGFLIHRLETDMDLLKRLDLPAILELFPPGSEEPGYLTLSAITDDKIHLKGTRNNQVIETNADEIQFFWSGIAYIPWKNFLSIWGTIPLHAYRDSIITLKLLLQDLGYKNIAITDEYDDRTRQIVEEIQAKYGIPVDGFVGPLTKIILYREKKSLEMPHLMH